MTDCDVLIIGGGPAGLRTAELVSAARLRTVLADQKPSVGRKFLVAGRGGLNLTHSEPMENFPSRYGTETARWTALFKDCSPDDLRQWAQGLGIETFIGTSGRVFPMEKQAAPLLRRWIERLRRQGVVFRLRHRLTSFSLHDGLWRTEFATPEGTTSITSQSTVLALGGASWPQTGSDGTWAKLLSSVDIGVTPLAPSNCGYDVAWPADFLVRAEGRPLKNLVVHAGDQSVAGELLITRDGLEGGALYQLGRTLRSLAIPRIEIDLKPTFSTEDLAAKLGSAPGSTLLAKAVSAWKLSEAAAALLELPGPASAAIELAARAKALPLTLKGPRPIEEAISSAGGIHWDELTEDLMIRKLPGLFCAGEMIDWDAPTGGYLLQGCMATGTRAGQGVIRRVSPRK